MQEVQHVLDSADERTLQAEQRALKAEEATQVCCHVLVLHALVAHLNRLLGVVSFPHFTYFFSNAVPILQLCTLFDFVFLFSLRKMCNPGRQRS